MSICLICRNKVTRNRTIDSNNTCTECIINLKKLNYEIVILDDKSQVSREASDGETGETGETDDVLNFIDTISDEIKEREKTPIIKGRLPEINCMINDKDALLASLYSQVTFLKNEIEEKNLFIRTLMLRENDVYNFGNTRSVSLTSNDDSHIENNDNRDEIASSVSHQDESIYILDEYNTSSSESSQDGTHIIDELSTYNDDSCNEFNEEVYFKDLYLQYKEFEKEQKIESEKKN